ncbi:MAG: hypothetical protein HYT77_06850 [Deltaproteobacteria bacterium]|nr:hypothetical protein [Deltaproteobacteria bacterium]
MGHFMPYQMHVALALQFIALVSGVLLLNKACGDGFFCKKTGKIIGGFVTIATILSILCLSYIGIKRCCHKGDAGSYEGWHHPPVEAPGLPEAGKPTN